MNEWIQDGQIASSWCMCSTMIQGFKGIDLVNSEPTSPQLVKRVINTKSGRVMLTWLALLKGRG